MLKVLPLRFEAAFINEKGHFNADIRQKTFRLESFHDGEEAVTEVLLDSKKSGRWKLCIL